MNQEVFVEGKQLDVTNADLDATDDGYIYVYLSLKNFSPEHEHPLAKKFDKDPHNKNVRGVIIRDGLKLNNNGKLEPYEDGRVAFRFKGRIHKIGTKGKGDWNDILVWIRANTEQCSFNNVQKFIVQ